MGMTMGSHRWSEVFLSSDKYYFSALIKATRHMSRKKIAAGNWKMNTTVSEGVLLAKELCRQELDPSVSIILCVPYTHITSLIPLKATYGISIASQNMHQATSGAYTGEISGTMLADMGVSHVVLGHSERRTYYGEDDTLLAEKLRAAFLVGLIPIYCCGESLSIRKSGNHIAHVLGQISAALEGISEEQANKLIIAYEPVWAIGTGETATPEQAQEMHAEIRHLLSKLYSTETAEHIPILYGGSVKPDNARELFVNPDVDGGLVGGASLDVRSFAAIVNSF